MKTQQEIKNELMQYTGTEGYTRHSMFPNVVMTDGVLALREMCKCYWLIDDCVAIAMAGLKGAQRDFVVFRLTKSPKNPDQATLDVTDGNDNELAAPTLYPFTDFPLDEQQLWLVHGGQDHHGVSFWVLMLPSEY